MDVRLQLLQEIGQRRISLHKVFALSKQQGRSELEVPCKYSTEDFSNSDPMFLEADSIVLN